jgi:hypothetical protein
MELHYYDNILVTVYDNPFEGENASEIIIRNSYLVSTDNYDSDKIFSEFEFYSNGEYGDDEEFMSDLFDGLREEAFCNGLFYDALIQSKVMTHEDIYGVGGD